MKLIAIDLDGTLLNEQKEISARNQVALKAAKAQGAKVVICTGRPLSSVHSYIETLGLTEPGDYSITFNGGLIQQNDTGEVLKQYTLSFEKVKQVFAALQPLDLPVDVVADRDVYQLLPRKHTSLYSELNPALNFKQVELDELDQEKRYNKMVVAVKQSFLDQQIPLIPEEIAADFHLVKSRPMLLEVLHKEVDKANALNYLATYLGIQQAEVMALGDEDNDLSMIQYAGMGVAMGNANDTVKKNANYITTTNQEDGVAHAVEKFVLK